MQQRMVIAYATNDITARGIDPLYYKYCMTLPPADRHVAHCGDYEQTEGLLIFESGVDTRSFIINIIDDLCYERQPKFIQVCSVNFVLASV